MSPENVELLRQNYDAVNGGDVEGALALVDPPPEFEVVPSGKIPDVAGVQRGPQGARRVAELFLGEFDDLYIELNSNEGIARESRSCALASRE